MDGVNWLGNALELINDVTITKDKRERFKYLKE